MSERGLRMTRIAFLLAGFAPLAFAMACAGPYGGARLIPAHTLVSPIHGYTLRNPDIIGTEQGVRIHGTICRRNVTTSHIRRLTVEWVKTGGGAISTTAPVYGMSSWRRPGCGYYSANTNWNVTANDTIRVR